MFKIVQLLPITSAIIFYTNKDTIIGIYIYINTTHYNKIKHF